MRLVSVNALDNDMVLARDIQKPPEVYLTKGQNNLVKYAHKLIELGICHIYIEDDKSDDIEITDVVTYETRKKCSEVLQSSIEELQSSGVLYVDELAAVSNTMINEILANPDAQLSLIDIGISDEYTFEHSVSTTIYALLIATRMDFSFSQLEELSMGVLLHDVGKTTIPSDILFKEGKLTDEEFGIIKAHTSNGYELLKNSDKISENTRLVSLTHHERLDGTGYPNGLSNDNIPLYGKIATIADVYDALTANRCYRKKFRNIDASNYLIKHAGTWFDYKLLTLFLRGIAIYPNGSMVQLSDGRRGLVKQQNPDFALRPLVRILYDSNGNAVSPYYEVDLMTELNVTIIDSQTEYTNLYESKTKINL